jgi:hypothetical protein
MLAQIFLKQAQRSVPKRVDDLVKELALAEKGNRNSDAYLIKSILINELGWEEPTTVSGVTPEIAEIEAKDEYWSLIKNLDAIHPPKVKKNASYENRVEVSASLYTLWKDLDLLLDKLGKANVTPSGETAHHELKATETDLLIGQQIHLAQTSILVFIDRLLNHADAVGDPNGDLLQALTVCGFIGALQDYLKEQGCNMQGAANLKKMLKRIECTGKAEKPAAKTATEKQ